MPFILLGLVLFFSYAFSSWLGVVATSAAYILIYLILTKLLKIMTEGNDLGSFEDSVRTYIGLIFAGIIFLTVPIWDSEGYCEHQSESFDVAQQRTLEDRFKGVERVETFYKKASKECKARGGWEFAGGWDTDDNIRVLPLYILGFFGSLIAILALFLFGWFVIAYISDHMAGEDWQGQKKKITPGIGKPGRKIIERDKCKDSFDFYYRNMLDIVTREHLSKGDFEDWFGRCARTYIDEQPKFNSRCKAQELVTNLKWANGHIETMYSGKSIATGEKRAAKITTLITQLEDLR